MIYKLCAVVLALVPVVAFAAFVSALIFWFALTSNGANPFR